MSSPATDQPRAYRSPLIAVILSGLFPGLGQLYNRQKWKALLFAVVGVVTAFGPFSPVDVDIDPGDPAGALQKLLLASMPFLLVALWSIIDAFRVARRSSSP